MGMDVVEELASGQKRFLQQNQLYYLEDVDNRFF
jgi:hypothetical protein